MTISTLNLDSTNESLFSDLIKMSFEGTEDSKIENWFSYEEMILNIMNSRGVCLIASEEGKICAAIYAQAENPINGKEGIEKWIINLLAVLPSHQGKSIGKKLVFEIEEIARKKGVKKIFVTTNELDKHVQMFYMGLGYEYAGTVKDYQYGNQNSASFFLKYL